MTPCWTVAPQIMDPRAGNGGGGRIVVGAWPGPSAVCCFLSLPRRDHALSFLIAALPPRAPQLKSRAWPFCPLWYASAGSDAGAGDAAGRKLQGSVRQ